MTTNSYEDFVAYYGGTSAETLRKYASETLDDPERRQMFILLAIQKESGVVFVPDGGGKLRYKEAQKP